MYPKFLYHKTEGAKLVNSELEESELSGKWEDSPAKFGIETCPAAISEIAPQAKEMHEHEVEEVVAEEDGHKKAKSKHKGK